MTAVWVLILGNTNHCCTFPAPLLVVPVHSCLASYQTCKKQHRSNLPQTKYNLSVISFQTSWTEQVPSNSQSQWLDLEAACCLYTDIFFTVLGSFFKFIYTCLLNHVKDTNKIKHNTEIHRWIYKDKMDAYISSKECKQSFYEITLMLWLESEFIREEDKHIKITLHL